MTYRPIFVLIFCLTLGVVSPSFAQHDENDPIDVPSALTKFDGKRVPREIGRKPKWEDEVVEIDGEIQVDESSSPLDPKGDERFPEMKEPKIDSVQKRPVSAKLVTWKSDDFQHRHLIFEEPEFERHGVGHCSETRQFLLSSKRFFGKALFLPVTTMRGKPWQWQCAPGK